MAGGTKRLPRAVREQQMLDAAVQMFSVNGYHETSMDAIAAQAEISKPMLYLYYGSKEELFGACLDRELGRFVETVRGEIDFTDYGTVEAHCRVDLGPVTIVPYTLLPPVD
jgi:AcrR family transcriptional regulator